MADIPVEVINMCILPRLPVKTLLRFKCVSKALQTLISSPDFIRLHTLSSDASRYLILRGNSNTLYLHDLDSPLAPPLVCHCPTFLGLPTMTVVASCEFFLLIMYSYKKKSVLILLNPATGSYYQISHDTKPNKYCRLEYRVCLDQANVDYKVVRIIEYDDRRGGGCCREVMVYSFKTNLWKLIDRTLDTTYRMGSVVGVNVNSHLLHANFWSSNNHVRIGCFNILAEQWTNDVPLPDNVDLSRLCVLDGLLCVLGMDKEETNMFCVWVMKEYGVKDSWVKIMSLDSDNFLQLGYLPIAYRKGSRHEVFCRRLYDSKLFWYNLRDNESTPAQFSGVPEDKRKLGFDGICKRSVITFRGGQHIKLYRYVADENEGKAVKADKITPRKRRR